MTDTKHRLTLQVVVPEAALRGDGVELRPLVDGRDILAVAFTDGPGEDPKCLLLPGGPLIAGAEPHEVRLAEASCVEACCGALYVTLRRDGDEVVWSDWRNPDRDGVDLPEFRFDAGEYRAEVERAVADRGWEWPARTVARLLEQSLVEHAEWLAQWECELGMVEAPVWEPDRISLFLFHPSRSVTRGREPWLQFRLELDVSEDDPAAQAARFAAELAADDPRMIAEVCGGSAQFARELGYRWPQRP
ncbi:hypothetical protein AB0F07_21590 [Streptomyces fructofermentans]|uniref:hypothetical protein n=1 Tax=Streptomyces fructofermentans TaxID=152141 RepID=UPI0033D9AA4B